MKEKSNVGNNVPDPHSRLLQQEVEKIRTNGRNRSAAYELALRSEKRYQPGDQISYYVTGDSEKVQAYGHCKHAREWDSRNPDENVRYYQRKLRELYKKFSVFFEDDSEA